MTWNDITVSQFIELNELKPEDCKDLDEFVLIRLSILFNTSPEEIGELYEPEFNEKLSQVSFLSKPPQNKCKPLLNLGEITLYKIEDFNTITIGEYIDLEHFFETDFIKNLKLILATVYRQKEIKNSPLFPDQFEKYGNYIFHRQDLFDQVKITDVYGVINEYITFRQNLMELYTGLFEDPVSTDEAEEEFNEFESIKERAQRRKEEEAEKNKQKWSWFYWLYKLAQENHISLDQASGIPLIEAFNIMAMKKELNIQD